MHVSYYYLNRVQYCKHIELYIFKNGELMDQTDDKKWNLDTNSIILILIVIKFSAIDFLSHTLPIAIHHSKDYFQFFIMEYFYKI